MTDHDCGCQDCSLSRRSLLKAAGAVSAAGVVTSMFGDVMSSTVFGATQGNVLVVVSLRGGADGLSMVVPHAEQAYYQARPTTAIPAGQLLCADATFGLHPAFAALEPAWHSGALAAVHATGLPTPNRSHFEAMEAIEDAAPGSQERVGWLNRMIGALSQDESLFDAVMIGNSIVPTLLAGPRPTLATHEFASLQGLFAPDPALSQRTADGLRAQYQAAGGLVGEAGVGALELAGTARTVASAIAQGPQGGAQYPAGSLLSEALKSAAGLIRAGVGVKAVAIDAGGWDHHVELSYRMDLLTRELARALAAFWTDLGDLAQRVTIVTISEFGRRVHENGAAGVDHGYGNAMLLLGAGVRGGQYYARWPGLGSTQQIDGDLAVTTDFRAVLAEVIAARFPSLDVSRVFPGVHVTPLGFMR